MKEKLSHPRAGPLAISRAEGKSVWQCSKLRVHPAPCVHNLAAGCMAFETCAPGVCMVFRTFRLVYKVSNT